MQSSGSGGASQRRWLIRLSPWVGYDLDHRGQTPSFHLLVEFLFKTLEVFGVFGDGPHVFLEDELLGWSRTDHFREPPEVGRAATGLARIANILPEEKGLEAAFGGFEIAQGIFASAAQVPDGFVRDLWHLDRGQIP